jgi:hypothetical protein
MGSFLFIQTALMAPPAAWAQTPQNLSTTDAAEVRLAQPVSSTQSIQSQSGDAGESAKWGGILAGVAAGVMGSYAWRTCSNKWEGWACPLWIAGTVAAAVVAINMLKAKDKADSSVGSVSGANFVAPTDVDPRESVRRNPKLAKLDTALSKLEKEGYKFDLKNNKATLPGGQSVSGDMVSSPQAMASAGFSPSQIADFQKGMNQVQNEAAKLAASMDRTESFAGGGGAARGAGSGLNLAIPTIPALPMPSEGAVAEPVAKVEVAGLTRNLEGEPIGVSRDNLFGMIHRRYQLKLSQNELDSNLIPESRTAAGR